jgi:hypothetical protein
MRQMASCSYHCLQCCEVIERANGKRWWAIERNAINHTLARLKREASTRGNRCDGILECKIQFEDAHRTPCPEGYVGCPLWQRPSLRVGSFIPVNTQVNMGLGVVLSRLSCRAGVELGLALGSGWLRGVRVTGLGLGFGIP